MIGRVLSWLSSLTTTRITTVRTSSRPLTEKEWAHWKAAFDKMDEAFAELRKIK